MPTWDIMIESLRDWISWDRSQVESRERGISKDYDLSSGTAVDVTDRTVREAKERIGRNEKLLAAAERRKDA